MRALIYACACDAAREAQERCFVMRAHDVEAQRRAAKTRAFCVDTFLPMRDAASRCCCATPTLCRYSVSRFHAVRATLCRRLTLPSDRLLMMPTMTIRRYFSRCFQRCRLLHIDALDVAYLWLPNASPTIFFFAADIRAHTRSFFFRCSMPPERGVAPERHHLPTDQHRLMLTFEMPPDIESWYLFGVNRWLYFRASVIKPRPLPFRLPFSRRPR